MRLLLVNYEYPPLGGGAATATQALARCFVDMGHEVTVLTSGIRNLIGESDENGVRVIRLATGRLREDRASVGEMFAYVWRAMRTLPRIQRSRSCDAAIVFFSVPCGPVGWLFHRVYAKPYIVSLRGGDVPGFLAELDRFHWVVAPIRRLCLRAAATVVANSHSLAQLAHEADGGDMAVIPNGVDTNFFLPAEQPPPTAPFRFVFVGRLTVQKRLSLTLRALKNLRIQSEGVRLSVIGDGPLRDKLVGEAAELGVADIVEWHGWVSRERLTQLYREAHCLLQPSAIEGMSNTVLEAMASGLAVIVSEGPGNRDLVTDRQNGLVVPVDDLGALVSAMRTLRDDTELTRRLRQASRENVVERHSWAASARAYLALLGSGASEVGHGAEQRADEGIREEHHR